MNIKNRGVLRRFYYIWIMLVIFAALFGMRWMWTQFFPTVDEHQAVNGVMDLRGVDLQQMPVMYLNGEWELYPNELLTSQQFADQDEKAKASIVQVPGDWRDVLQPYGEIHSVMLHTDCVF